MIDIVLYKINLMYSIFCLKSLTHLKKHNGKFDKEHLEIFD